MRECKYSLIRYYADALRSEPINIGLVLHDPRNEFLDFELDLRRAAAKVSKTDKEVLKHLEGQFDAIQNDEVSWSDASIEGFKINSPDLLDTLSDAIGNKIRFDPPRGLVTDNPAASFESLYTRLVSVTGAARRRVTKQTLITQVKAQFDQPQFREFVKSRPTISGAHREYKLPLGIRHSHRTFIDALNVQALNDATYRAMASIGRLWKDAQELRENRQSNLCAYLHYKNGQRFTEGERLLNDDGVAVVANPRAIMPFIDAQRLRPWQ